MDKNYTVPYSDFEIKGKPLQKIPEASRNLGLSQKNSPGHVSGWGSLGNEVKQV